MNLEPTDPSRSDAQLERRARALFEESAATVAPPTAQRLARARAAALAEATHPRASWLRRRWFELPRATQWAALASGVAAVSALGLMLSSSPLLDRIPVMPGLGAEDAALVAALNTDGDDIEMLRDLEFYSWLGAESAAHDGESDENIG